MDRVQNETVMFFGPFAQSLLREKGIQNCRGWCNSRIVGFAHVWRIARAANNDAWWVTRAEVYYMIADFMYLYGHALTLEANPEPTRIMAFENIIIYWTQQKMSVASVRQVVASDVLIYENFTTF